MIIEAICIWKRWCISAIPKKFMFIKLKALLFNNIYPYIKFHFLNWLIYWLKGEILDPIRRNQISWHKINFNNRDYIDHCTVLCLRSHQLYRNIEQTLFPNPSLRNLAVLPELLIKKKMQIKMVLIMKKNSHCTWKLLELFQRLIRENIHYLKTLKWK